MTTSPQQARPGAEEAFERRYGQPIEGPQVWNETLALLLGHRSVRAFRPDAVTLDQVEVLVSAAQSAPTSSNLQAWSVVVVRDPERKARLAHLAAGQAFIDQAPVFLVWIADFGRHRRLAERRGRPLEGADFQESTLIAFLDAALAAQNAVVAAESLGLGSTFVGAIRNRPEEVAAELGLPPHAFATFGLAVGVPDPDENAGVKPRLPRSAVLHHERYDTAQADAGIEEYDGHLADYNARHGLDGSWTERILRRLAGPESLAGRDRLRESLANLGWPSR